MKKKIIALLMAVSFISISAVQPVSAASKKAYIKPGVGSKVTVLCGKTLDLKAKTVNKKKKITYKSSKTSVATVSSKGIVKGKKYGTAVITLKASGMASKKVTVSVRKPVTSLKLTSKSSVTLKKGKTSQIQTKVLPGGKEMVSAKLSYKSSNTKVATVNSKGKITAKSGGYAKITVSTNKSSGKVCTKYVDVFIYDGFNNVCQETTGNKTIFTFNPKWRSVTINFVSNNKKTYSYKVNNIKGTFNAITTIAGFSDEKDGVRVTKEYDPGKNIVNFKIVETGENYNVAVDNTRYQLTFDKKINGKVTFKVELAK